MGRESRIRAGGRWRSSAAITAVLFVAGCSSNGATTSPESLVSARPTAAGSIATSQPTVAGALATRTPEPAIPTFAPIELSGKGPAAPTFTIPEGVPAIAEIVHVGRSNFAVWTINASGNKGDLLVNKVGNYRGTVLFDMDAGDHSVALEIEADGSWTATIGPWLLAPLWDGTGTLTAKGDGVQQIFPPRVGPTTVRITHDGSSNFTVRVYSGAGRRLLVNEIGTYSGEVPLPSESFLLQVTADGTWSIETT